MATLIEVATRIQDLYEQNYTPNDRFLDIDDFKFMVATTYSAMVNALYKPEKQVNKREEGFSNIEIPQSWLLEEPLEIKYDDANKRYYANTKYPVFFFDFDNNVNAFQDIEGFCENKKCKFKKISLNEKKFLDIMPPIGVVFFHLNSATEILFYGLKNPQKAICQYMPVVVGQQNDCLLSDNIVRPLIDSVLETFFKAKNGNFIQKLDNQNPNIAPAQQLDPAINGQ